MSRTELPLRADDKDVFLDAIFTSQRVSVVHLLLVCCKQGFVVCMVVEKMETRNRTGVKACVSIMLRPDFGDRGMLEMIAAGV